MGKMELENNPKRVDEQWAEIGKGRQSQSDDPETG